MSRTAMLGTVVIAAVLLLVGGIALFGMSEPESAAPSEAVPAATAKPEQAEQTKPAEPEEVNLPPSRQHVRKSNLRLLHPPEKKDFSKMAAPAKEQTEEQAEED